jgi:uncharacterized protein YecE (DUF72 family)
MGDIRVGTASWTDPEFIKAGWYPTGVKSDAEARLRFYAERFSMVEVNASFYALPTPETVSAWAERTPPGFRFHVKANGVVSGHPSDPARLPPPLRTLAESADLDSRGRIRRPGRHLRDAVIDAQLEAMHPLGSKLGAVLVQLPPYVVSGEAQREELGRILARFRPARCAVEFRHRSWVSEGEQQCALDLLSTHDAAWVIVDAPRIDVASAMPTVIEATTPALAYLRLHGRNPATWTTGKSVAEKYDYVYSEDELEEWVGPVLDLAERTQEMAVVFNNNSHDYPLKNAARFSELVAAMKGQVS